MTRCSSPFLLPLLHAFQDTKYVYLVLPLQIGGDMGHYIRTISLFDEKQVQFYGAELILALETLHQNKILFRDLKPSNILFTSRGHVQISDFGLAAVLKAENNYYTSGDVGTVGYQAPEIVAKDPYSFSVDYFSLGVSLYRMATGRRPYGSRGKTALIAVITS